MNKNRISVIQRILIVAILLTPLFVTHASIPLKRIYIVDCSGSMKGIGISGTSDVFKKAQTELSLSIEKLDTSSCLTIIPFVNKPLGVIVGNPKNVKEQIERLEIADGNTNILSAWKECLYRLDNKAINFVYLISDGFQTTGCSEKQLLQELEKWKYQSNNQSVAYLYVPDKQHSNNQLIDLFKKEPRMEVIYNLNQVQTVRNSTHGVVVTSSQNNFEFDYYWLLVVIVIIILIIVLYYMFPIVIVPIVEAVLQAQIRGISCFKLISWKSSIINLSDNVIPSKYNPKGLNWEQIKKKFGIGEIRKRPVTEELDFRNGSIFTGEAPKGQMDLKRSCHKTIWQQYAKSKGISEEDFNECWKYADGKHRLSVLINDGRDLNDYTVHERFDGQRCDIVPNVLNGNISHNGGVSYQSRGQCSIWYKFGKVKVM